MTKESINSILIVDDNIGSRRSIEALLSNENYKLILAKSGHQALTKAREEPPDLILLDVMMPGMDGFEVCSSVRADRRLSEIPIIMITALDDEASTIRGIDAGADDFLSKPINRLELRSRVRGILRLNRYRKLCAERKKFEHVVENSKYGYIVIDKSDNITFSNPKARELLEFKEAEPAPINFFSQARKRYTIRDSSIGPEKASREATLSKGDPLILVRAQTEGSDPHWITATSLEIGYSSHDQRLVRLEDVTSSIRSFQDKHTFSRMISHKLLTPLNALKAADQLISSSPSSLPVLESKDIFEMQHEGLERLEYDIQSILKYLESTSDRSLHEASTRLDRIADSLNGIATEAGIHIEISVPDTLDPNACIQISEYNLEACVREIVENAIKFSLAPDPSIACVISVDQSAQLIRFEFASDSKSLSPSELQNAWKPYWQADQNATGEIPGMGLGLALIATNVWSAGGTCEIRNRDEPPGVLLTLSLPFS